MYYLSIYWTPTKCQEPGCVLAYKYKSHIHMVSALGEFQGQATRRHRKTLGSKVATPWLSILHNSAITREATGMHFHPCFCVAVCGYDGLAPGDSRRGGHPHLVQPRQQQRGCWPPGAAFNSSQCILGRTSFLPGGQGNEVLLFWARTESHLSLCEHR